MRVIEIEGGKGPAEALRLAERLLPEPAPGEIRIRVRAAGVNRPDIVQREGRYPAPPGASDILGLEVAGEIDALGEGVTRWTIGDRVCALLGGGGYAEYAVVDARQALPVPDSLDFVQAAALPETAFTVFANVFEGGGLKTGETLLIHGATSGIGVMAIQMPRRRAPASSPPLAAPPRPRPPAPWAPTSAWTPRTATCWRPSKPRAAPMWCWTWWGPPMPS